MEARIEDASDQVFPLSHLDSSMFYLYSFYIGKWDSKLGDLLVKLMK